MTAYLKRGDVVHLAVPMLPTDAEQQDWAANFIRVYEIFGVMVSIVTHTPDCPYPTVVSVIRKDEEQP